MTRFQVDLITGSNAHQAFETLLNSAFGVPANRSFLEDFPVWNEAVLPSGEEIVRLGAFVAGSDQLAACAGVRIAKLSGYGAPGATPLTVALIGAVATDPAYRGEGLASNLVTLACDWAKGRGAAAVYLWGSEYALYQRLGFELCGSQVMLPLDGVKLPNVPAQEVRQGWDPAIFTCMKSRRGGLQLEDEDERWVSAHRSVEWFWTGNGQACNAYLGVGRGIDLAGIIHEWGGDSASVVALLSELQKTRPGLVLLGAPRLLREIGIETGGYSHEFLALTRIFDAEKVVEALRPTALEEFQAILATGQVPSEALPRLLFGPPFEQQAGQPRLPGPLPLWIWGLDAV